MKRIIFLSLTAVVLFSSCGLCKPPRNSREMQERVRKHDSRPFTASVVLKEGGTIAKALQPRKATLISVHRTMKGFKNLFITDTGDTLVRFYPKRFFKPGECYLVQDI